ncbi:MAG TPA: hypothetical protein VGC96_06125 [Candidatus Elarobacter sp.]
MGNRLTFARTLASGVCGIIDAVAVVIILSAREMVPACGPGSVEGAIFIGYLLSGGILPVFPALGGIAIAALFPRLRSARLWLASAAVLSFFAWAALQAATTIPRGPSNGFCAF